MTNIDKVESPWGRAYQPPAELMRKYCHAIAYVSVTTALGDESIDTAFHVGDGVLITARHVVEGNRINEIGHSGSCVNSPDIWFRRENRIDSTGCRQPRCSIAGPLYHPNPNVDVAVIVLEGLEKPAVPLGFHLDDWLDSSLILSEAIVMGYPPIPLARSPVLVTARAEVNAIVDLRDIPHPRFVLSSMARGGFSGGPAISCYDFSLGVITDSLCHNNSATELGYLTALTVEPILEALGFHKVLPKDIVASWTLYGCESPWGNDPSKKLAK